MKTKLAIVIAIIISLTSISYGSLNKPETREEFEQKVRQQQAKIEELETMVSEQEKQILDLKWQIYHLEHKPEPNEVEQSEEKKTETKKLQTVIKDQKAEIARLKELCLKARIDPNSQPNQHAKLEAGTGRKPNVKQEKVVMPKYTVLDENIYDIPIKTQVELNILVSGKISETGLKALLNKLYSSTKARRGFKYHNSATNIYIYAFTSKERAESGMGQWIAMLQQSPGDVRPRISIDKRQIAQLGAKPEQKFRLSESKRRQIFYELVMAGDNATELAIRKYPNDIMKQIDYENKIREANEQKVRGKYNITKQQMYKIKGEGVTKAWPMPSL